MGSCLKRTSSRWQGLGRLRDSSPNLSRLLRCLLATPAILSPSPRLLVGSGISSLESLTTYQRLHFTWLETWKKSKPRLTDSQLRGGSKLRLTMILLRIVQLFVTILVLEI